MARTRRHRRVARRPRDPLPDVPRRPRARPRRVRGQSTWSADLRRVHVHLPVCVGRPAVLPFGYGFATAVLFGLLWASHTLVAYPIVQEHGLLRDRAVGIAGGGTAMTDTLALSVLAVVAGSVASDARPIGVLLEVIVGLVILALFCAFVLPRATRWVFAGVGQHRGARFLFVVVALTAAALVADRAGIGGIVGAFFAGLALNRLVPARSRLMEQIEFVGGVLLIPFFLLFGPGMLIDPAAFTDVRVIAMAGTCRLRSSSSERQQRRLAARVVGLERPQRRLLYGPLAPPRRRRRSPRSRSTVPDRPARHGRPERDAGRRARPRALASSIVAQRRPPDGAPGDRGGNSWTRPSSCQSTSWTIQLSSSSRRDSPWRRAAPCWSERWSRTRAAARGGARAGRSGRAPGLRSRGRGLVGDTYRLVRGRGAFGHRRQTRVSLVVDGVEDGRGSPRTTCFKGPGRRPRRAGGRRRVLAVLAARGRCERRVVLALDAEDVSPLTGGERDLAVGAALGRGRRRA